VSDEFNDVKVDLALIKKDIKQIERFFSKVDNAVDDMSDISKTLAVQQEMIKNFEEKFNYLKDKIDDQTRAGSEGRLAIKAELDEYKEEFKEEMLLSMKEAKEDHARFARETREWNETKQKETIAIVENLSKSINDTIGQHDSRLRSLENTKWYLLGIFAVIMFLFQFIDIPSFASLLTVNS
jgi:DNA repair exonuclease SbcCD ATPase subunit